MQQVNLAQKLMRARTQLLLNQPFFGTLCLRLRLVCTPEFPTMATNGRLLVYNAAFVEGLSLEELEGTFAHEVMHCALGHHCRRGNRDPLLWNAASDYAINPILLNNGMVLPAGVLVDASFANLSAEEIYSRLLQQQQGQNQSQAPGSPARGTGGSQGTQQVPLPAWPGGIGEVIDATTEDGTAASQAQVSRQMHEWSIAAEQAMCSAKACGRLPSGVDRPLQNAKQSVQDWRAILRDFVAAMTSEDYRWMPPNRRFVASRIYLPSVERKGVGELVIAVDTSGSIGTEELEQFAGEITAISDEVQPERDPRGVLRCRSTGN